MIKAFIQRFPAFYDSKAFVWGLIGFGAIFRLSQYLFNRSLWLDEAKLAVNISQRSFLELLEPLKSAQGAPVIFLMIEKLLIEGWGNRDYVLRLFPLLCGLISLYLFYKLAMRFLSPRIVPLALCLFAVCDALIYYSSELKQYSSDVMTAVLLFLVTFYIGSTGFSLLRTVLYGVIGMVAIWLSYPAVFVLAGTGSCLFISALKRRDWKKLFCLSLVYGVWIVNVAATYLASTADMTRNVHMQVYWSSAFMPFPPMSLSDGMWFVKAFFRIFVDPVSIKLYGLAALVFLAGFVSMFSARREDLVMLISPLPFALLASGLHLYPFQGRMLVFLIPTVLILIAEGTQAIVTKISIQRAVRLGVGVLLIGLLLAPPLASSVYHLAKPRTVEEIKPVIHYVKEHKKEGDVLYLYHGAKRAFQYYAPRYGFSAEDYRVGKSYRFEPDRYLEELDQLRGVGRVWVLFSHVLTWKGTQEGELFLSYLDKLGYRLDSFKTEGAYVYLYDMGPIKGMQ